MEPKCRSMGAATKGLVAHRPSMAAAMSGVTPFLFAWFTSAPFSTSTPTTISWPYDVAVYSALPSKRTLSGKNETDVSILTLRP